MKPWIAELATVSDAAVLAHCLSRFVGEESAFDAIAIGRSDASGNSGDGGLEVEGRQ
jgi:hypothetical protein